MKIPTKGLDYDLCERTDLAMDDIVRERSELMNLDKSILQFWHAEAIERRLAWLNGRIVEEYLKK